MKFSRILRGVAVATLMGATFLSGTAFAQTTITGGFDVGPGGAQAKFNPLMATAGFTWQSIYYEPLLAYNAELTQLEGALASDWQIADDLLSITFNLNEATWHDGEDFTSADVKFSIDLYRNENAGGVFAGRLSAIEAVETPDDRTVVLKLSRPDGSLLSMLSQAMILPEHALGSIDPTTMSNISWWSDKPIGTGPFKFNQYVTDQYVELVANEEYRLGRPKVDRLINRYFDNPASAVAALRAGEIQFTYVEPDDAATFANDANFRVIEGASYVVNYIGFNYLTDLWNDIRVRQAVMHAIDRDTIIESLYNGVATRADCGYTASHLVPEGLDAYAYDPEKARQLLAEADWASINGDKPIPFVTYYNSPQVSNVMAAMQAMLSQVGINVVPQTVDAAQWASIVYRSPPVADEFPFVYAGLQNGPDPAGINVGLNGSQLPPAGSNVMRVDMPELSAAFDTAMSETNQAEVNANWQEVCKVMNEQLPWATMWVANRYGVASTALENFVWTPAPAGGPFLQHAELWSIK